MNNPADKHKIHSILAHSYSVYFVLFITGVLLDATLKIKLFESNLLVPTGVAVLLFGTIVIIWAQHTSRNLEKKNLTKETFCKGPYCYTRSPTHWALCIVMLGFGIIANAVFVVIFTVLSFLVTKFFFIKEEEKMLEAKYGAPYREYKKSVKI